MTDETLARAFDAERRTLLGVAYRMLGSVSEAEDAVQEAWLRLARTPPGEIQNLGAWLRTVVGRICLDTLRQRRSRREESLAERLPDPLVEDAAPGPEQEVLLGEAVGLALQAMLEELPPAERVAFVLHDVFAMPFEEIAPILERTPAAARQLASRGRRRVREVSHDVETDPIRQREAVDAFVAAVRSGDVEAVVGVLDPEVVLRLDAGHRRVTQKLVGAGAVAKQAIEGGGFRQVLGGAQPAVVNGGAGLIFVIRERAVAIVGFTVSNGRIVEIDALADPARVPALAPR